VVPQKFDVTQCPTVVWYVSCLEGTFHPTSIIVEQYGVDESGLLQQVYCEEWGWISLYSVYESQEDAKRAADGYNHNGEPGIWNEG
jgi:hypothetical protein